MTLLDALTKPVIDWMSDVLRNIGPAEAVGLHSDELARRAGLEDHSGLEVALYGFVALVSALDRRAEDYMAMLSIDLEVSDALDSRVPPTTNLEAQMSSEPPSIYLVDRRMGLYLRRYEGYRCPMPGTRLLDGELRDVYFFYECNRSEQARMEGWEYSRKIYAEHYPPSLVLL